VHTRRKLCGLGAKVIGAGENSEFARRPVALSINDVQVGFLSYCKQGAFSASSDRPGSALLQPKAVVAEVSALKRSVDHVIVIFHWGVEFSDYPYPPDIEIAHSIIDAGASAIIGHHPHVVQGLEVYKGCPIFYSLGSFIYDPWG